MSTTRTNARAGYCELCGMSLPPGQGRLEFIPDAHDNDDFDRVGTGREHAHWAVFCLSEVDCQTRAEATAARHAAERAEKKRIASEASAIAAAAKKAKQTEWETLTAGLVKIDVAPTGWKRTGEHFEGLDVQCEKISLPGELTGWLVSWIGDSDGSYWLVPLGSDAVKKAQEIADRRTKQHRVWQWWTPDCHDKQYPGPGVPESELTEDERAEVEIRRRKKQAAIALDWRKRIDHAIIRGNWFGSRGCGAWEALTAAGASVEVVIDDEKFAEFCRLYSEAKNSHESDALRLTVTLRAKLPKGKEMPDPASFSRETNQLAIKVRVEYV